MVIEKEISIGFDKDSLNNVSAIYQIINLTNGRTYIGSSIDVLRRYKEHNRVLKKNKSHNSHLQRSFNKNGEQNFEFEILEQLRDRFEDESIEHYQKYIIKKEQFYIDTFDTYNNGYNSRPKADSPLGIERSKKTIEKHKQSLKEYYKHNDVWNKGKKTGHIPWNKDKKNIYSQEQIDNLSSCMKNRHKLGEFNEVYFKKGRTSFNKGKSMSEKTKLKISKAKRGVLNFKKRKTVVEYNPNNNKVIKLWQGAVDLANSWGVTKEVVYYFIRTKRTRSDKKYTYLHYLNKTVLKQGKIKISI